jgi:hypothetical protein
MVFGKHGFQSHLAYSFNPSRGPKSDCLTGSRRSFTID